MQIFKYLSKISIGFFKVCTFQNSPGGRSIISNVYRFQFLTNPNLMNLIEISNIIKSRTDDYAIYCKRIIISESNASCNTFTVIVWFSLQLFATGCNVFCIFLYYAFCLQSHTSIQFSFTTPLSSSIRDLSTYSYSFLKLLHQCQPKSM